MSFIPSAFSATLPLPALASIDSPEPARPTLFSEAELAGKKIEDLGDLYLLTRSGDPPFMEVYEKLPQGGFGRLLRYRGLSRGGLRDLEFIYEDQQSTLTILDYGAGRYFRITLNEKPTGSFCLFPSGDAKGLDNVLQATSVSPLKFIPSNRGLVHRALPEIHWNHSQVTGLSEQQIWSKRLVRGPPGEGLLV